MAVAYYPSPLQASGDYQNIQTVFGAIADATETSPGNWSGTDNTSAFINALTSGLPVYIPPGKYLVLSTVNFGAADVNVVCDGTIVVGNTTNFQMQTTWSNMQTTTAIQTGYVCSNTNGFAPNAGGSGYVVGDILEVKQGPNQPLNYRTATRFSVATVSAGAILTLNVLDAGIMVNNPGASPALVSITGSGSGATVNNITWTAPQTIGQRQVTAISVGGTNTLSNNNSTLTLQDGTVMNIGDKIKLISNQTPCWDYSTGMGKTAALSVQTTNGVGIRIANGGSGYAVNDTIKPTVLTAGFAKGTGGMPVQSTAQTDGIITVDAVTSAGAITAAHVSTAGLYSQTTYDACPMTAVTGVGTGAQFYLTYTSASAVLQAEFCEIANFLSTTQFVVARKLIYPHIFDGSTPPVFAVMPKTKFSWRGGTFRANGNPNNTAITGRTPACIRLIGVAFPVIQDITSLGVWERMVEELGCFKGDYKYTMQHGVDNQTQGGFGYGFASAGSCGSRVSIQAHGCRHVVSGGTYHTTFASVATTFYQAGASMDVLAYSCSSHNDHGGLSFDCHEDCINWTFDNCESRYNTPDPNNTSGAPTSSGFTIRGYNTTVRNCRDINSNAGFVDVSHNYPFTGVFGIPSKTKFIACIQEGALDAIASNGTAVGFSVVGPGFYTNSWGANDLKAETHILHCSAFRSGDFLAVGEGINRVIINAGQAQDCNRLASVTGPVDLVVNGLIFDNNNPTQFQSNQARLFNRLVSTNVTGACTWDVPSLTVNVSGGISNPSILFSDLDTVAGNSVLVRRGTIHLTKAMTLFTSSGGTITVQDALNEAGTGRDKTYSLIGVNLNTTNTDNAIPIPPQIKKYMVIGAMITNVSVSLTTATAGLFTATGGGGDAIVATQALSALTGTTTQALQLTLAAVASNKIQTVSSLQFRNVVAQGAAATGDVFITIRDLTGTA